MMEDVKILVFAGTSEGRLLAEYLNERQISTWVCVATEYGEELMEDMPWVHVRSGRMDADEMESLMRELSVQTVVDATHPYADLVTENIKAACRRAQVKYLRLLRASSALEKNAGNHKFSRLFLCGGMAEWTERQCVSGYRRKRAAGVCRKN